MILSRQPFEVLGPLLEDFGHSILPIRPNSKAPVGIADWPTPRPCREFMPYQHPKGFAIDCRHWGTGVLGERTPAIDIDVRDRRLVKILLRLAEDMFEGPMPIRVGALPKALLPFALDGDPFPKFASRWFAQPTEDFTAEGFRGHRVEVIGADGQFVAFAIHPDTGRHYRWARGSLLTYHAVDLAPIEQHEAAAFVAEAESIMLQSGMIPLCLSGKRYRLDVPEAVPRPPPHRRPPGAPGTVRSRQFMTPEELARAIDPTTAHASRDGSWRLRCPVHRGEHCDSLKIAQGTSRALVWRCFADCSQDEIRRAIEELL
jgi:hypothetical protein